MRLQSPALIALTLMTLPFLVGFDVPDSSGVYVKGGVGHGTYHVSGCNKNYDFEYNEAQLAFRKTIATAPKEGATGWARLKPEHTTFGVSGDYTSEKLVSAWNDSPLVALEGLPQKASGFEGNLYVSLDWEWIGIGLGVAGMDFRRDYDGVSSRGLFPSGSLRLGPEWLFASAELLSPSRPLVSGGGLLRGGVGGRLASTRVWLGVGGNPYKTPLPILDVAQTFGSLSVSLTAMADGKSVAPLGEGIDQQSGIALGLEYRLPGL
jgi:hypothetical protein